MKNKKQYELASTLKFDDVVYDPIRIKSKKLGWMKYRKDGKQEIIDSEYIEHDGIQYKLSLPNWDQEILWLPNNFGSVCSETELFERIKEAVGKVIFISSDDDINFLSNYFLATWNFEEYDNVSYLSITGLPGSGKSQLLNVAQQICQKSSRCNGADSDATIFRSNDIIRGTLTMDEAQRDSSDYSTTWHKILADGYAYNGSIKRCSQTTKTSDYEVESYNIFGPKIFSGRDFSADTAIQSRTHEIKMAEKTNQSKIAVESTRDKDWEKTVITLQNDLLLYRQKRRLNQIVSPGKTNIYTNFSSVLTSRAYQVSKWLFMEAPTTEVRESILRKIQNCSNSAAQEKSTTKEGQVLLAAYQLAVSKKLTNDNKVLLADIISLLETWKSFKLSSQYVNKCLKSFNIQTFHTNRGLALNVTPEFIGKKMSAFGLNHEPSKQFNKIKLENSERILNAIEYDGTEGCK